MKTYVNEIEGLFYPYAAAPEKDQVYSIGPDNPPRDTGASVYFARWTRGGVKYVSNGRKTKSGAVRIAKKYGDYQGEANI